eukprot:TRINITY_DN27433_c0_g1_i1.p1 TRINITY_DN27433_c0_g1~~TRINITY_DN27433_c0_g1_i1.p1  ORF type:complete len:220 (-),score=50.52 TRINITY_DN27433_c0_g1_i1:10-669(-)
MCIRDRYQRRVHGIYKMEKDTEGSSTLCEEHGLAKEVKCSNCNLIMCSSCLHNHSQVCGMKLMTEFPLEEKKIKEDTCEKEILRIEELTKGFQQQRESLIKLIEDNERIQALQVFEKEIQRATEAFCKAKKEVECWSQQVQQTMLRISSVEQRATHIKENLEKMRNSAEDKKELNMDSNPMIMMRKKFKIWKNPYQNFEKKQKVILNIPKRLFLKIIKD